MPVDKYDDTIAPHGMETDFDRVYAFYQGMERQESSSRLLTIIGVITALVIAMLAVYLYQHPVNWQTLATPYELHPGL